MKQITHALRVVAGDAQLFAHVLVKQFRQGLGRFHAQAVEIEIARELVHVEEQLRLLGRATADGDYGESNHIKLAGLFGQEEISDRELAAFALPRKGETLNLL